MATYGTDDMPTSWDDVRDTAFFRIIASLFSPQYTFGASVLLASYDETCEGAEPVADLPTVSTSNPLTSLRHYVPR